MVSAEEKVKITKYHLMWDELGKIDDWCIARSGNGEFRLYHEPEDKSHGSKACWYVSDLVGPICGICSKEVPQEVVDVCLLGNVWLRKELK